MGTSFGVGIFAADNPIPGMSTQANTTLGMVQGFFGALVIGTSLTAMAASFAVAAVAGAAFIYFYETEPTFKTWADDPVGTTPQLITNLFELVGEKITGSLTTASEFINEDLPTYKTTLFDALGDALLDLKNELSSQYDDFKNGLDDLIDDLGQIVDDAEDKAALLDPDETFQEVMYELFESGEEIILSVGRPFQNALEAFARAFQDPPRMGDPLVLDLDNDGFELIDANNSNIYFDYNGDNLGERTGWVAPDDGFLALDKNNNGLIDDVSELFGNLTMTGFEELALYDATVNGGNADGVINADDAIFSDLLVWQDLNSNGVTDAGELKTLGD